MQSDVSSLAGRPRRQDLPPPYPRLVHRPYTHQACTRDYGRIGQFSRTYGTMSRTTMDEEDRYPLNEDAGEENGYAGAGRCWLWCGKLLQCVYAISCLSYQVTLILLTYAESLEHRFILSSICNRYFGIGTSQDTPWQDIFGEEGLWFWLFWGVHLAQKIPYLLLTLAISFPFPLMGKMSIKQHHFQASSRLHDHPGRGSAGLPQQCEQGHGDRCEGEDVLEGAISGECHEKGPSGNSRLWLFIGIIIYTLATALPFQLWQAFLTKQISLPGAMALMHTDSTGDAMDLFQSCLLFGWASWVDIAMFLGIIGPLALFLKFIQSEYERNEEVSTCISICSLW